MFKEWYKPNSALEFPRGGSQAMIDALVRGVTKHGGKVRLGAHVEGVLTAQPERGWRRRPRAAGVRLRDGSMIHARKAVVANCATPELVRLLPQDVVPPSWRQEVGSTPLNPSFMHLHLGFDATGGWPHVAAKFCSPCVRVGCVSRGGAIKLAFLLGIG